MIPVDDPEDLRLADYRAIKDGAPEGAFYVEGAHVVRRFLTESRFPVRSVLLSERRASAFSDLALDAPVYVAPSEIVDAIIGFDFHRGVIAIGERRPDPAPAELLEGARRVLVLEAIANHDNVGAAFRSAAGLGADAVLLDPRTADPLYRKAIRVSIGTTLSLPWARLAPWPEALDALRARGFVLAGLSPEGATELGALAAPAKLALLVGTEGAGLDAATLARCDLRVSIPMRRGVDSLNAATAAAIAMYVLR